MAGPSQDLCERWLQTQDSDITPENVQDTLQLVKDDFWVVAACADRILEDATTQRAILELGLERTKPTIERCKNVYPAENSDDAAPTSEQPTEMLTSYFSDDPRSPYAAGRSVTAVSHNTPHTHFALFIARYPVALATTISNDDGCVW